MSFRWSRHFGVIYLNARIFRRSAGSLSGEIAGAGERLSRLQATYLDARLIDGRCRPCGRGI
jgi:hypothetical protein